MEITEENIQSIAVIGFDNVTGPILKWKKEFPDSNVQVEQFLTSFYIMFNNGSSFRPMAMQFDNFSVITIFKEMDLICFFLKNKNLIDSTNLDEMEKKYIPKLEKQAQEKSMKDELSELLQARQMTVKEIRKHFKFSPNTIRKLLKALEEEGKATRIGLDGKAVIWGAA